MQGTLSRKSEVLTFGTWKSLLTMPGLFPHHENLEVEPEYKVLFNPRHFTVPWNKTLTPSTGNTEGGMSLNQEVN